MARKTSPKYQSKEEIVRDLTLVLNEPLSPATKYAVVRYADWKWTEFDGKYNGAYWTEKADSLRPQIQNHELSKNFIHEHIVPINVVCEMLLDLKSPTFEQVHKICEKFMIGAVVTREENRDLDREYKQEMPPEFFDPSSELFHEPWLRYIKTGIKWIRKAKQ